MIEVIMTVFTALIIVLLIASTCYILVIGIKFIINELADKFLTEELKEQTNNKSKLEYIIKESIHSNLLGDIKDIKYSLINKRENGYSSTTALPTFNVDKSRITSREHSTNSYFVKLYKEAVSTPKYFGGYYVMPIQYLDDIRYVCINDEKIKEYWWNELTNDEPKNIFITNEEAEEWCMINGTETITNIIDDSDIPDY